MWRTHQRTALFPWPRSWLPPLRTGTGGQPAQYSPHPGWEKEHWQQQLFRKCLVNTFRKVNTHTTSHLFSHLNSAVTSLCSPSISAIICSKLTSPPLLSLLVWGVKECKGSRVQFAAAATLKQRKAIRAFTERVSAGCTRATFCFANMTLRIRLICWAYLATACL